MKRRRGEDGVDQGANENKGRILERITFTAFYTHDSCMSFTDLVL